MTFIHSRVETHVLNILIMAFLHVTKYLIFTSKPLMLIVISNKQAVRVVQCNPPIDQYPLGFELSRV